MSKQTTKILVVDDEEDGTLLLKLVLEEYDVEVASSYDEAVSFLKTESFELVVSDYRMPEKDGIDLLNYAGKNFPDMKFIILTGHQDISEEMNERAKFNCDSILSKGCADEEILEAVEKALQCKEPKKISA